MADSGALLGIAGTLLGVMAGAGFQILQNTRTQSWQERVQERAELERAASEFLTATWRFTSLVVDTPQPLEGQRKEQLQRALHDGWAAVVVARTRLDLYCTEDVYELTKTYVHRLRDEARSRTGIEMHGSEELDRAVVEQRRRLMNALRVDLGRRAVLQKRQWPQI